MKTCTTSGEWPVDLKSLTQGVYTWKPEILPLFSTFLTIKFLFLCMFVCRFNNWIVKYVRLGARKCDQKDIIVFEEEMGHFSSWHTSELSTKKWHYTELPWRQMKGRIRCGTSYSFVTSWVIWRNASRFGEYKKHICAPIGAQFHISNFIFSVTDGISSNRSRKYESTMSTKHNHVQLTCYQSALLMPLFYTKFLVSYVGHFAH